MDSSRSVIDYALVRRAALTDLAAGRLSLADVCDAHPYLLRAAKHHGALTPRACPVCRDAQLTEVTYVYGDELREASGQARSARELSELEQRFAELRVHVVEVCSSCHWNHLTTSFVVGKGQRAPGRRRRAGQ